MRRTEKNIKEIKEAIENMITPISEEEQKKRLKVAEKMYNQLYQKQLRIT